MQINQNLILKQKLLPFLTGVYYFSDLNGNILYIGKAKNLRKRTAYYFKLENLNKRLSMMVFEAFDLNYYITETENEAFLLEAQLIKEKLPKYNIQYKNGRAFSYIFFTNHEFPQIKIIKNFQNGAFGPFLSYFNIKVLLQSLLDVFKLRTCSDFSFNRRKKPCLEYYSKKCSAPCVRFIDSFSYLKNVEGLKLLLQGKNKAVISSLKLELKLAVEREDFERAKIINDNIKYIDLIVEKQGIFFPKIKRLDIVLFYDKKFYLESIRNGAIIHIEYRTYEKFLSYEEILNEYYLEDSKVKIIGEVDIIFKNYSCILSKNELEILSFVKNRFKRMIQEELKKNKWAEILKIDSLYSIEAYDCSHYNSRNPLCAMISASIDDEFFKNKYKIWNLPSNTYNDLEALEYGLIKRGLKNLPDLILIDGGITQLNVAKKALYPFKGIIAFAKGENRKGGIIYSYDGSILDIRDSELLLFLEKLRTSSHNWAKGNSLKKFTDKFI